MRVLVTGCAGFIGSHIAERMIDLGHEVVGVDCFVDYYPRALKENNLARLREEPQFSFRELDISVEPIESVCEGVDVIYHQAAQPGVRASWGEEFETYTRHNVLATQRLLEAVKARGLRKLIYASSSSIYGDAEAFPTSETALPTPISPYGTTKLAGEHLTYLYWRNYGVPTVALRYFTVYGPRQRPDMAFHRFIRAAINHRPIQIYGDGEQTRDFTFVSDAVDANVAAANLNIAGVALNIGGGSRVTVNYILQLLGEISGSELHINYVEAQKGDVRHTSADTSAAARLLGYTPVVDLPAGLRAEFDWFRKLDVRLQRAADGH
ncbi:MAG: NAD-dependent epimerase/dehydratase family protein [Chloroflexi bacterium]|nr:NAD-dependent epimerase/dehydratase family protein [Chloroflexota bacterium]